MMGYDKSFRYELHPPMSFGDMLAALFRRNPKTVQAKLLPGPKPEFNGPESTQLLQFEDRYDEESAGLQVK